MAEMTEILEMTELTEMPKMPAAKISDETEQLAHAGGFTAPEKDPLRGFYGIISATLMLEAISLLLSIAVICTCVPGKHIYAVTLICILCLGMLILCSFVKKPWFWWAVITLHIIVIVSWYINAGIGICGIIYTMVWFYVHRVGKEMRRKIACGALYGQKSLSEQ